MKAIYACSVFALQMCLHTTQVHVGPYPHDQLNAKDPDPGPRQGKNVAVM